MLSRVHPPCMTVTISPPQERACELCGREERWDPDATGWRIVDDPGNAYCIHEWDINGTYTPLDE